MNKNDDTMTKNGVETTVRLFNNNNVIQHIIIITLYVIIKYFKLLNSIILKNF